MKALQRLSALALLAAASVGCSADGGDSCALDDYDCIRSACTDESGVLDTACVEEGCGGDTTCIAAVIDAELPGAGNSMGSTGETSSLEDIRSTCGSSNIGPRLLRRLTRSEVDATMRQTFPELEAGGWEGVKLSPDVEAPSGLTTDASVLVVSGPVARELLKTAESVAEIITSDSVLESVLPCTPDGGESCTSEFVNNYGLRLFRRPLGEDEVTRYVGLASSISDGSDFSTGLKWALVSLIQSPHAVYRSEIGEAADGGGYQLTQYELATNLAYTYTGAPPDQALLDVAASGALSDSVALQAQASLLLDTSPLRFESMRAFLDDWLEYSRVRGASRTAVPEFAAEISEDLITETRLFFDQVVFGNGGDVTALMTADFTAVNENLATFYGLSGYDAAGDDWQAVSRNPNEGLGLLAQGSLMAAAAHQEHSSPTFRGLMFSEKFLCSTRPAPPDVVPPIEEAVEDDAGLTTREKYELHHLTDATCASCHQAFEPYGYALEGFDETGRFRSMDAGKDVNASASVPLPDGSNLAVEGQEGLARLVESSDHVENCFSGLLAAYLMSGAGGTTCLSEESRAALAGGQMSIKEYAASLAAAPHFSSRR